MRSISWKLASMLCFVWGAAMAGEPPVALSEAVQLFAKERVTYRFAVTDLNDDGIADAVVLLTGRDWCGSGGCTMLVLSGTKTGFNLVSSSTVTSEPISVLPSISHAWHTLLVHSKPKGMVAMPFDGKKYPSNPSMQPSATTSQATGGTRLSFAIGE